MGANITDSRFPMHTVHNSEFPTIPLFENSTLELNIRAFPHSVPLLDVKVFTQMGKSAVVMAKRGEQIRPEIVCRTR